MERKRGGGFTSGGGINLNISSRCGARVVDVVQGGRPQLGVYIIAKLCWAYPTQFLPLLKITTK